jgi:Protein of unknown function (DUF4242)
MDAAGFDTYLVEAYLPRTSPGGPAAVSARARAAAAEMRRTGTEIRFLRSFFVPEDELWFCFYEARAVDDVAEASKRAELALGRIQQAVDDEASIRPRADSTLLQSAQIRKGERR